ncbi:MAG: DoxX family protein [Mangrovibacterium sp.]|nr:DoxX family protein [Mangrovibacterium sp.]
MTKLMKSGPGKFVTDFWLLIFRVAVSVAMLTHGIPKLQMLFSGSGITFADPLGIGDFWTLILVVFAEVVCSGLLILGAFSRLTTVPLIVNMAVAFFVVHGADPFGKKELALLYLFIYLTVLVFGGGDYSLDRFFKRR